MTQLVITEKRSLDKYSSIVGDECIEELSALAEPLRGARVLHLNATAAGGGVAEILRTLVPLMCDLGLNAEWRVLEGADEFFKVTKTMHNALQGIPAQMTSDMIQTWLEYNNLNADFLGANEAYDFVVVHDPQPASILRFLREGDDRGNPGIWIWRCHLDLSTPGSGVWSFLKPYVEDYDAAIFTKRQFFPKDLQIPSCFEVAPGIDPLDIKNRLLDSGEVRDILLRYGIDPARPFILQVSRFDPWKDFRGLIDIYDLVKKKHPEVQLVLVGGGADDDPESQSCYQNVISHAQGKGDIHILYYHNGFGLLEIDAFRQAASVVAQKSIREGFGLVVTEALWKSCPVVASNVGGIALQVLNGETGYLAGSVNEWVAAITCLLQDSQAAAKLGSAGSLLVQQKFLITSNLGNYLKIFGMLGNSGEECRGTSSTEVMMDLPSPSSPGNLTSEPELIPELV